MIPACLDLVDCSSFSPVKENSNVSKSGLTSRKIFGIALIVFGVSMACAFTGCLIAAGVLGNGSLATAAAVITLIGIGIIMISTCFFNTKKEEFLIHMPKSSPHVSYHVTSNQNSRGNVPQISRQASNDRLHVMPGSRDPRGRADQNVFSQNPLGIHVTSNQNPSRQPSNDRLNTGLRRDSNVMPGSRDPRGRADQDFGKNVKVGTR